MNKHGISEGDWTYVDYAGYLNLQLSPMYGSPDILDANEIPREEAEANARLCVDAGNTYQKCGLLPSELLRERDDLREQVRKIGVNTLASLLRKREEQELRKKQTVRFTRSSVIVYPEAAQLLGLKDGDELFAAILHDVNGRGTLYARNKLDLIGFYGSPTLINERNRQKGFLATVLHGGQGIFIGDHLFTKLK